MQRVVELKLSSRIATKILMRILENDGMSKYFLSCHVLAQIINHTGPHRVGSRLKIQRGKGKEKPLDRSIVCHQANTKAGNLITIR